MTDRSPENDPMDDFLNTLGEKPEETKVLRVPEVIPTIMRGPADPADSGPGDDAETPLEGSDAEAYAALKAKRAERRRKKLIAAASPPVWRPSSSWAAPSPSTRSRDSPRR